MLSGTVLLTAVGLFSQALGFVYRIALSRMVGAEVMGLYQLVMPVFSVLLSLTAVGLTVAVSTLSARYQALGDWSAVRGVLRRGLLAFLALAVPLGIGVVLASDAVSVYLLGDARTQLGVVLLAPCVLLTGVENLHKHCFYGTGNVRPPAASETVEQLVRTAAVLGLLAAFLPQYPERAVGLIVCGMIVCEVFSSATLVFLFRRQLHRVSPVGSDGDGRSPQETVAPMRLSGASVTWKQLFSISVPVSCTSLLGTLMGSANSVLIPQKLVEGGMESTAAISAFGVLCGMTVPMLMLPMGFISALGLTMVPSLAQKAALEQWDAIREQLGRVLALISLVMAPAMALLTVLGPVAGRSLFRNEGVGQFMLPLACGVLFSCWQSVLAGALNGLGRQRTAARNAILCDGVQLAFTWFTVPRWGLAGYVAGFVCSCVLAFALDLRAVCAVTGLRPQWLTRFFSPALAALLMGLCANLLFRILTDAGVELTAAGAACTVFGVALYAAALQAQGVKIFNEKAGDR